MAAYLILQPLNQQSFIKLSINMQKQSISCGTQNSRSPNHSRLVKLLCPRADEHTYFSDEPLFPHFKINLITIQTLLNCCDSSTPWQLAQPHLPHFPLILAASALRIRPHLTSSLPSSTFVVSEGLPTLSPMVLGST